MGVIQMISSSELKSRIERLPTSHQLLLAASCGRRATPIYDNYWDREHSPDVSRAVEWAWSHACEGVRPSQQDLELCLTELLDIVEMYNEEGIGILAASTTVALRSLQCLCAIVEGDIEKAALSSWRACRSMIDVASLVDYFLNNRTPETGGIAEQEEDAWQTNAIVLLETPGVQITPDTLDSAGAFPPRWWPIYQNLPEHI